MNRRSLAAALVAGSLLPTTGLAQVRAVPPGAGVLHATVTYDLAQGAVTHVTPARHVSAGGTPVAEVLCFQNSGAGTLYADVPLGQEWVDWGRKDCGLTGALRRLEVGYGTTALDTGLGGPGASLELALYAGTHGTQGVLGQELVRVSLTGLPASDGVNPITAVVLVDLVAPLPSVSPIVPDGALGWGYTSTDGVTGPLLVDVPASAFGPDLGGYEADTMPDGFVDVRATGTDITSSLTLPGLQQGGVQSLPFAFPFYDGYPTQFTVSKGGHLVGGTTPTDYDLWGAIGCFPNFLDFDTPLIAAGLTDVIPDAQTTVHRLLRGQAPFRELVFQWSDLPIGCQPGQRLTMQTVLFETTGAIEFHYEQAGATTCTQPNDQRAKIGCKGVNGQGLAISCNGAGGLALDRSYRITRGPEGPNGTTNLLNRYIAPARPQSFVGSFVLLDGTGAIVQASSLHLGLREEDGSCGAASITTRTSPNNPTIFSGGLPRLGATWTGSINVPQFFGGYTSMSFATSLWGCTGGCPSPWGDWFGNPFTYVLTTTATPAVTFPFGSRHPVDLPANVGLCGMTIYAQAALVPGSAGAFELTNGLDLVLGF